MEKVIHPFSLTPLFLHTITFILIIMSSFILIMFGERIEAHGFANTITVWRARQSCRMTATCMTAARFPNIRYITWHVMEMQHVLPDDAKMDPLAGAHLCRHRPGIWNYVSVEQFGEQTYITKGKMPGGLKGLTMSEDQVAIWVESYPICAHVTLAIESMYSADDETKEEKRKEEGEKRRIIETDDRSSCLRRVEEAFPSSQMTSSSLYNIINGKVVNASVNAHETLKMVESMFLDFRRSLPCGFHAPLKINVKTMEYIKCQVAIGDETLCDIASPFCVFITVEQHRQAELQTLFDYELCAVPASIIDECGCLRTGTKSILVSKLKVDEGRRSCWSSCNAWSWHTPCTTDQLPAVSSDVNSMPSLLVCCLPEHYLVVCSPDVICQISVYRQF